MNLVDYPSSDESGTEPVAAPKPTAGTKRAAPEPLVDVSNPGKIRINLGPTPSEEEREDGPEGPPSKRSRTGGGGLFGGLSSFLPAPKRSATQPTASASGEPANGEKPTKRAPFKLKTSAEVGFERGEGTAETEAAAEAALQQALKKRNDAASASPASTPVAAPSPKDTPVKKPFFRPMSMTEDAPRRKKKKKKAPAAVTGDVMIAEKTTEIQAEKTGTDKTPAARPAKAKVSLFSIMQDDTSTSKSPATGDYQPMLLDEDEDDEDEVLPDATEDDAYYEEPAKSNGPASHTTAGPQSLETLAATLSESERRQLFGRKGATDLSHLVNIDVKNFNTDAEYTANEELRAKGEQQEIRAPRGIKPGKHSLRQLVNVAVTQKDALEDSYARGAANKREAGSKYGW
jgi:Mitotic checkpoint regulator, MAD2B-interacting